MALPPRPLTPGLARRSLAQRTAGIADRVRQRVSVHLGMRPYRVFLTWTKSGASSRSERGDGHTDVLERVEILPIPRVQDLTAINARSWSVGTVPEGSIRVDRVSAATFTEDVLRGLRIPKLVGQGPPHQGFDSRGPGGDQQFARWADFFYEVVEDGRGDDPAYRRRFRLLGDPFRDVDGQQWVVLLQRADRDMKRDGTPPDGGGFPVVP